MADRGSGSGSGAAGRGGDPVAARPTAEPGPTRLVVALVRGLHGLRGTVRIEVLTDRPEDRLVPGAAVFLEGERRPLTIASAEPVADGPGWWLTLGEVASRTDAERLRGRYLEVEVDRSADLGPGQAYWHEIIGSLVRGAGGRDLGRVVDIYRAGESEVYLVRDEAGRELDLPAVRGIVLEFAPERGEIVVDEEALDLGSAPVDRPPRPRRPHRWSRHGKGRAPAGPPAPGDAS
jgi:16S rRNA processing protein RimM